MKKWLGYATIAFVLFFLITEPGESAIIVKDTVHGLGVAAKSMSTFVTNLT